MFSARLRTSAEGAWRKLGAHRRASTALPELELPPAFAEVLAATIAHEASTEDARAEVLRSHYLDHMPALRVAQLATAAEPEATLFHTPLDWRRLPRTAAMIDSLYALLKNAGVETDLLGTPNGASLRAASPTFGALYQRTFYGACMPLLYGYPADLAHFGRALAHSEPHAVMDTQLCAPLLHELTHLDRTTPCLYPLHLDECVAGYLGVRVLRESAYPVAADSGAKVDALYATPWLAQVGQALVRVAGLEPVVRAHAGVLPWTEALPMGLCATLEHAGWQDYLDHRRPHLLSDTLRPEPWLKLLFVGAARALGMEPVTTLGEADRCAWRDIPTDDESPFDREILADALDAMCLRNEQHEGHYLVATEPPRAPILVDLETCSVSTAVRGCDRVPPRYLFPPATAARLRSRGIARYVVELSALGALPEVLARILDGVPDISGKGYALHRQLK